MGLSAAKQQIAEQPLARASDWGPQTPVANNSKQAATSMEHFDPMASLLQLALDLRWTWSHAADSLWRRLDAERWSATHNPWHLLHDIPPEQLNAAVRDPQIREQIRVLTETRARDQGAPCWCQFAFEGALPHCVAYFSMEFGLGEALPLHAGGLGVLAGDTLKGASDLGLPMVGVGLLYQEGYFRQSITADGSQLELYPYNEPASLPIQRVLGPDGGRLHVPVQFPGRTVRLRVWRANVGRVPLYLLDSNDPLNTPADRGITAKLYGRGPEVRLMQEILLGVGGWQMLQMLGIEVDVCHLNEGHAAFAGLERARQWMRKRGVLFDDALTATRGGNVFTTHTPVEAGFDRYGPDLVCRYLLDDLAREARCSTEHLLALGRKDGTATGEPFNMGYLAMRTSIAANGVSRLHGAVSRRLFQPLFPRWPEREVPVGHVTNGVHVPSWDSPWSDRIWTEACGKARWRGSIGELGSTIETLPDEVLWSFRAKERQDLIEYARSRLSQPSEAIRRGAIDIPRVDGVLLAHALTLGFARRFTGYKRPNLLLHDRARFARLLQDPARPVQIVVAGKAHPADEEGKRFIREWIDFSRSPNVLGKVVFLEDYDMSLAQQLVQGIDVWINTPRRPWEASGTSGMKVLVNGGLNLSAIDGWWAEAFVPEVGWAIGDERELAAHDTDAEDADQLYETLERQIVPLFYQRDASGLPRAWIARIRASMARLAPEFSTNRMLCDYLEKAYIPAAEEFRRRSVGDAAHAIAQCSKRLRRGWSELRFDKFAVRSEGERLIFTVEVRLGALEPADVRVELYAEPTEDESGAITEMHRVNAAPGASGTCTYEAAVATRRRPEDYTPRIVTGLENVRTPIEMPLILWHH